MKGKDEILAQVTEFRRDLHRIPELGFFVYRTGAYVKNVLSKFDCRISTIAKTGILAFFDFGKKESICFRADMDALPIKEETSLPFASEIDGCMHACGHDGHMANALCFAGILDDYKKQGKVVNYNALILFQPAEETIDGAKIICSTDVFARYNVKAIFGLHVWPFLEKGEIATKPGPMMAKSTTVKIEVRGLSSHCGEPEKGHDALLAACRFVDKLYSFKDKHVRKRSILKFGKMKSGNVLNAISDYTRLDGTMRTFEESTCKKLVNAMKHYGRQMSGKYNVNFDIDVSKFHPAVVNDEELYNQIKPTLLNDHINFVELRRPVMIAEDFSFFEEVLPGIFFFLGTGTGTPLHSSDFNFDEKVLVEGVHLFNTIFTKL